MSQYNCVMNTECVCIVSVPSGRSKEWYGQSVGVFYYLVRPGFEPELIGLRVLCVNHLTTKAGI